MADVIVAYDPVCNPFAVCTRYFDYQQLAGLTIPNRLAPVSDQIVGCPQMLPLNTSFAAFVSAEDARCWESVTRLGTK
jgi:hypothetical protein